MGSRPTYVGQVAGVTTYALDAPPGGAATAGQLCDEWFFGGFSLLDVPDCAIWNDSAKGLTLAGAAVTSWADQTVYGFAQNAVTVASRPTRNAAAFQSGATPGVAYNAATPSYTVTPFPITVGAYTLAIGARVTSGAIIASHSDNPSALGTADFSVSTTNGNTLVKSNGAQISVKDAAAGWAHDGLNHVIMASYDLTHASNLLYKDNVIVPLVNGGFTADDPSAISRLLYIGAVSDGTLAVTAVLRDIALYLRALIPVERYRVNTYCAARMA